MIHLTCYITIFNPIRAVCPGITLRAVGGGQILPSPRSQLVVVRFSKSLWFPKVLRNSYAKFDQDRAKNMDPAAPRRKSARAAHLV